MTATDDLLWNVREASCCLICASGSTCSEPEFCRSDAARYIEVADKIAAETYVTVYATAFGAGHVKRITPDARLEIALDEGGTVTAHASEVVAQ